MTTSRPTDNSSRPTDRDYSGNEAEIEVGSDWIKVEAEIEAEIEACRD
jgi:hypothetical protein